MNDNNEQSKFRILIDGFDMMPNVRFDSAEEAEQYIQDEKVWQRAQYCAIVAPA